MNPIYRAALWVSAHLMPWAEASGRGFGIRASDNRDAIIKLRDDPLVIKSSRIDTIWGLVNLMDDALAGAEELSQDVLTLYGTHDMLIPEDATAMLARRLSPDSHWAVYDTGWHMLLRDHGAAVVLDDIASWIKSPGTPLPSGAEQRASEYFTHRP
jgi:pimeloyl-ACP methyl ester carboxylesterase